MQHNSTFYILQLIKRHSHWQWFAVTSQTEVVDAGDLRQQKRRWLLDSWCGMVEIVWLQYVTKSSSTLCKWTVGQCSIKFQQLSDKASECVQNDVNSNCEQFSSSKWFFSAHIQGHKSQKLCVENCVKTCGNSKWVWFMDS